MELYEKYRPKSWEEIIGQDKAVQKARFIGRNGWEGKALWIKGNSGIGKTTMAKIIAGEFSDDLNITETTGRELTASALREWAETCRSSCIFSKKQGRTLIVNESHGLCKATIEILLNLMEEFASGKRRNGLVIFTTTTSGNEFFEGKLDAGAFARRVHTIPLTSQGMSDVFADHARKIADKEGLGGKPEAGYKKLAVTHKNSLGAMLHALDGGAMYAA